MTVYYLTQIQFTEGEFGDIEVLDNEVLGIYSSLELAEQAKSTMTITTFNAQFGKAEQTVWITAHELDSVTNPVGAAGNSDWDDEDDYEEDYRIDSWVCGFEQVHPIHENCTCTQ